MKAKGRRSDAAKAKGYEAKKESARRREASLSLEGRDIGPIPPVADPARKGEGGPNFRFFCETYFPSTFYLPWSDDHLRVIQKIETAVLRGGLFGVAMPRGSGKSTLAEQACLWSLLYGWRPFVCLIGSDKAHAAAMLESMKVELTTNERLLEDFPEVVYPVRRLEGIAQRATGQLYRGRRTFIAWSTESVVLPSIPGSRASGAAIAVAGLTGSLRGMKHKRPDGTTIRPSLVVVDDPQTDESARSLVQCAAREAILAGAVLGLAGPGKKISGIMPCTVIRAGDVADNILDPEKHPEWNGERTRMVYSFPANEKLWDRYAELRAESLRAGQDGAEATAFYQKHRKAMDRGAAVAWPERHNEDEISGLQHAMNLKIQDAAAFWAEYQNEPLQEQLGAAEQLTVEQVLAKLDGRRRGEVSIECHTLTSFLDVHDNLLYWKVCAWGDHFFGGIVDYGTYPRQDRRYFALRDARPTLQDLLPGQSKQAAILAGLQTLLGELMGREFTRQGGQVLRIRLGLIDAGYVPSVVQTAIRTSKVASLLLASQGQAIGAKNKPLSEYIPKQGDRAGHYWRIPSVAGRRLVPTVQPDVNYWKSRVRDLCQASLAEKRATLSLFGRDAKEHRLLADHLCAEYFARVEARGRVVEEWQHRPGSPDNHFLDCLVGNLVAASVLGIKLPAAELPALQPKRRAAKKGVRYFDL